MVLFLCCPGNSEARDSLLVTALEKDLDMTVQRLAIDPSLNIENMDSAVFIQGYWPLRWDGRVGGE